MSEETVRVLLEQGFKNIDDTLERFDKRFDRFETVQTAQAALMGQHSAELLALQTEQRVHRERWHALYNTQQAAQGKKIDGVMSLNSEYITIEKAKFYIALIIAGAGAAIWWVTYVASGGKLPTP